MSARSSANAVGPWQFIEIAAKMHGLKVNNYVDERKSIFKATEAAVATSRTYTIFLTVGASLYVLIMLASSGLSMQSEEETQVIKY